MSISRVDATTDDEWNEAQQRCRRRGSRELTVAHLAQIVGPSVQEFSTAEARSVALVRLRDLLAAMGVNRFSLRRTSSISDLGDMPAGTLTRDEADQVGLELQRLLQADAESWDRASAEALETARNSGLLSTHPKLSGQPRRPRGLYVVLLVAAAAALVSVGVYSTITQHDRIASENCAELLRLRELEIENISIDADLLGTDEPKVESATLELCPNSVEWATGVIAAEEAEEAEEGRSRPSQPESRTAEDIYTDPDATLLEKQCAAAADIYVTGNGPGSPYADYTDADLADQLDFYSENC